MGLTIDSLAIPQSAPGHARLGREACRRFGTGLHPARVPAPARSLGEALLAEDFCMTEAAL